MLKFLGVACGLFHAWFIICIEWKYLAIVAEWVFAPYLQLEGEVVNGIGMNGTVMAWFLALFVYLCETIGGVRATSQRSGRRSMASEMTYTRACR